MFSTFCSGTTSLENAILTGKLPLDRGSYVLAEFRIRSTHGTTATKGILAMREEIPGGTSKSKVLPSGSIFLHDFRPTDWQRQSSGP